MYTASNQTPYFPSLRCRLAAYGRRSSQALRRLSLPQLGRCLESYLPVHLLSSEEQGPNSRDRLFTLRVTFQAFLWQMLKPRTSCREVVRQVQALSGLKKWPTLQKGTSAYCQARQRLPLERLQKAVAALAEKADRLVWAPGWLKGRSVKVVDGTMTQLADTAQNRRRYPQSPQQRKGCGFPLLKLVALFSLSSGAILKVVTGNRHLHDLRLFGKLWDDLVPGDIVLGDRLFSDYVTVATLPQKGVDVVARANVRRAVDFRKAKRLGRNDGLFTWKKPASPPPYMTQAQWSQIPETITVRVVRFEIAVKGCRTHLVTLATTLLDPTDYPLPELAALYARRWRLELCFRDLKTQMGMEQLRCKNPALVEKELWVYLLAHNLVRCVMAEASSTHQASLERLSFKGSVDALRQFSAVIAQTKNRKTKHQLWSQLLRTIARDLLPLRPGRREPRALKRRPKRFPFLIVPRQQFKDPIRYDHWLQQKRAKENKGLI